MNLFHRKKPIKMIKVFTFSDVFSSKDGNKDSRALRLFERVVNTFMIDHDVVDVKVTYTDKNKTLIYTVIYNADNTHEFLNISKYCVQGGQFI